MRVVPVSYPSEELKAAYWLQFLFWAQSFVRDN